MRELKFRAWHPDQKIIVYSDNLGTFFDHTIFPYQDWVIEQFIGQTDKNGTEIYEGDIIRILYTDWGSQNYAGEDAQKLTLEEYKESISSIGFVIFEGAEFTLNIGSIWEGKHGEKEIIGNIHQE